MGENGITGKYNPDNLFLNKNNKNKFIYDFTQQVGKSINLILSNDDKAVINGNVDLNTLNNFFELKHFPDFGMELNELDIILHHSKLINFGSPNFFGQMHPSRNIPAIKASAVSSIFNCNMIAEEVSQAYTKMENQTVGFLLDLAGFDINKGGGTIVHGGTPANHTAMLVARNLVLSNDGDGVVENGIHDALMKYNELNSTNYKDVTLYVGNDNHYSIEKIAGYVGIGTKKIITIPYTDNYQIDLDFLSKSIKKSETEQKLILGVFVTGGTTEKGHVHDIDGVLAITKGEGQNGRKIYTHVDAAHGGGFLVNDEIKNTLFKGINESDSVTIDGHKMMYTNYSCGGIIFKDKNSLNSLKQSAKYILDENSINDNHGSITMDGSRGSSGVHQLWSTIVSFGKEGLNAIVEKVLENTNNFYEILSSDDEFELLSGKPDLNVLCFRYKPKGIDDENSLNEINSKLKESLMKDGSYYVGDTTIDNKKCFRVIFMNKDTSIENMNGFILKIKELYNNFNK